jgi:hypothetical protein
MGCGVEANATRIECVWASIDRHFVGGRETIFRELGFVMPSRLPRRVMAG